MKKIEYMTCKRFTKLIPDFLDKTMDFKQLESFLEHSMTCESCKEELSIQLLVKVGLSSLESDRSFDLQQELSEALEDAHHKVRMHYFMRNAIWAISVVGVAALALFIFILWIV